MRIHSITLVNFRGITERTIEFRSPGITIVEGPNEAGKSSIPEAIGVLFDMKDNSKHRRVLDVQPVTGGATEVTMDLTTGPYRLTYAKRWGSGARTTLTVHEPVPESLSGVSAHDRAREIFEETVDTDLWDALQQVQGDSMDLPSIGSAAALHEVLSEAGGVRHDGHDALLERIAAEHQKYWTSRGLKADVIAVRTAAETASEHRRTIDGELAAVDALGQDHAEVHRQRDEVEARLDAAVLERDDYRARLADLSGLREELTAAQTHHEHALTRRDLAIHEHERREALIAAHLDTTEDVRVAEADRTALAERLDALTDLDDPSLTVGDDDPAEAVARATAAVEWHALSARLDSIQEKQTALKKLIEKRDALAIDRDVLQAIENAHLDVTSLEARLEHVVPKLDVEILGDAPVTIDGEPWPGGEAVPVLDATTIEAPGIVRVTVTADARARDWQTQLEALRRTREGLLESAGVLTVSAARERAFEREHLTALVNDAQGEVKGLLAQDSLDDMHERLAELAERAGAFTAMARADCEQALAEAQAAVESAAVAHSDHRAEQARIHALRDALQTDLARATATVHTRQERRDEARDRLDTARQKDSDEALTAALASASEALDTAAEAVHHLETRLADAGVEALATATEESEAIVKGLRSRLAKLDQRRVELSAQLELLGERGLHDSLTEAKAEEDRTGRAWLSLKARADAAALLWHTFDSKARAARLAYVDPYRAVVVEVGRMVYGPGFDVTVDENLQITHRTLDAITVPFDSLSGGAREQLSVIARVATAALTSPAGGAPVIFDDALGHSDPVRQRAIGSMMRRMVRDNSAQIIILTCEPGRYDALGDVARVSLG